MIRPSASVDCVTEISAGRPDPSISFPNARKRNF